MFFPRLDYWGKAGGPLSCLQPGPFLSKAEADRTLSCQPPLCLGYLGLAGLSTPSSDKVRDGMLGPWKLLNISQYSGSDSLS